MAAVAFANLPAFGVICADSPENRNIERDLNGNIDQEKSLVDGIISVRDVDG